MKKKLILVSILIAGLTIVFSLPMLTSVQNVEATECGIEYTPKVYYPPIEPCIHDLRYRIVW